MRIRYCNLKCIKHLKLEKTQVDSCVFTEIEDVRFVLPMCASHTPATTISSYQQCGAWVLEISLMRPSFFSIFNNLGNNVDTPKAQRLHNNHNHSPCAWHEHCRSAQVHTYPTIWLNGALLKISWGALLSGPSPDQRLVWQYFLTIWWPCKNCTWHGS